MTVNKKIFQKILELVFGKGQFKSAEISKKKSDANQSINQSINKHIQKPCKFFLRWISRQFHHPLRNTKSTLKMATEQRLGLETVMCHKMKVSFLLLF